MLFDMGLLGTIGFYLLAIAGGVAVIGWAVHRSRRASKPTTGANRELWEKPTWYRIDGTPVDRD